jgi:hypothetical protein
MTFIKRLEIQDITGTMADDIAMKTSTNRLEMQNLTGRIPNVGINKLGVVMRFIHAEILLEIHFNFTNNMLLSTSLPKRLN